MSANDPEPVRYFALRGARTLLSQYRDHRNPVPDDAEVWRRDLFPVIR